MSISNMVANQGYTQRYDPKSSLVILKFSASKEALNIAKWEEGVFSTFANLGYDYFLTKFSDIEIPEGSSTDALVMDMVSQQVYQTPVTEVKGASGRVAQGKYSFVGDKDYTPVKLSPEQKVPFDANVQLRATLIVDAIKKRKQKMERRGVKTVDMYANPFTCVSLNDDTNPRAQHIISVDGERLKYEVESQKMREKRVHAVELIRYTLSKVDEDVYKDLPFGSPFQLFNRISDYYNPEDNLGVVRTLQEELDSITKSPLEPFRAFTDRFSRIVRELGEAGAPYPLPMLINKAHDAFSSERCVDENVKEVLNLVFLNVDGARRLSPTDLFAAMAPLVEQREKEMRRKGGVTEFVDPSLSARKKKQAEMLKRAQVAKAEAGREGGRGGSSSSSSSYAPIPPEIAGVCLYYQEEGGCRYGNSCRFKHKKLSKAQTEQLRSLLRARQGNRNGSSDGIECFGCGKKGVKKPDCPDCQKEQTRTFSVNAEDVVKHFSDEQLEAFARATVKYRMELEEKQKEKE